MAAFAFDMFLITEGVPYIFSSIFLFSAAWLWLNEFHYPHGQFRVDEDGELLLVSMHDKDLNKLQAK